MTTALYEQFPVANGLHADPKIASVQEMEEQGFHQKTTVLHKVSKSEVVPDADVHAFMALIDGKWYFLEIAE